MHHNELLYYEPKPCPDCGGELETDTAGDTSTPATVLAWVSCPDCDFLEFFTSAHDSDLFQRIV